MSLAIGKRYGVRWTIQTQPLNQESGVGYGSTIRIATQRASVQVAEALGGRNGLPFVDCRFDIIERPTKKIASLLSQPIHYVTESARKFTACGKRAAISRATRYGDKVTCEQCLTHVHKIERAS